MLLKKHFFVSCLLLMSFNFCNAQLEIAGANVKDFYAIGFGGFLNFSTPVSDANYVTLELGVQYFNDQYDEELALIPVLAGYRYTLNQSGEGFFVEPLAGYSFGSSTIQTYDGYDIGKVAGPTAGIGVGYLFDWGNIPFNFGLRYEHTFGNAATNILAFRIAHSFSFRRRESD